MLNKYKKRIQAIIFCIAIIVSCFSRYQPTAVYAAENESITVEYEDCKYEIYSDYAVLIKYQGENQSELNLSSTITYEGKEYNT